MQIIQCKDGFLWGDVTTKAKELFYYGLFDLYAVYNDIDYLINDMDEINEMLENGESIYIELSFIGDIKQLN